MAWNHKRLSIKEWPALGSAAGRDTRSDEDWKVPIGVGDTSKGL